MNAIKFMVSIAAGLLAHQTNPVFEELERNEAVGLGWYRMARYGVGTLAMVPTFILLLPKEERKQTAMAFLSNAVLFGFGVAIGYVLDKILKDRKDERN